MPSDPCPEIEEDSEPKRPSQGPKIFTESNEDPQFNFTSTDEEVTATYQDGYFIFIVDRSGSMTSHNKEALVRDALKSFIK